MRQPLTGTDFHQCVVHDLIRRRGGAGNWGQVRVRLATPLADPAPLARAWRRLGEQVWTLGAEVRSTLRGAHWSVRGPARLELETGSGLAALAGAHLRDRLDDRRVRFRLGCAASASDPGLVLTWDHRLCDARGALGLLAALPRLAAGGKLGERWWRPDYRTGGAVPASTVARLRLARGAVELMRPHRLARIWKPHRNPANPAAPLIHASLALGPEATERADRRSRAASGRFGETCFLLACVAAALEESGGSGGDPLFPFAMDQRPPRGGPLAANLHAFAMVRLTEGLARRDLGTAARHLADGYRAWLAAEGEAKMTAVMDFAPLVGLRLSRLQIGNFRAGLFASCLTANVGAVGLPDEFFGATVVGAEFVAAVPGSPGLGILFHRDRRGLCCDVIAAGRLARTMPPAALAERIRHQLVERPFPGAPA